MTQDKNNGRNVHIKVERVKLSVDDVMPRRDGLRI